MKFRSTILALGFFLLAPHAVNRALAHALPVRAEMFSSGARNRFGARLWAVTAGTRFEGERREGRIVSNSITEPRLTLLARGS